MMPYLEDIKILKIILYATFLRVWCMCNTIPLMLKEFFQAFFYISVILWWIDIHYCCHYVFSHGNLCDRYLCNSIGYELNWDIWVYPQLLIGYPQGKLMCLDQKSIDHNIAVYDLCEISFTPCESLEVFNFPEYSVSGTMSTKWIPSLIWIVPVG